MSKTAQRKRDAYHKGYNAGRWRQWGEYEYRFPITGGVMDEFLRGLSDGKRDRWAASRRSARLALEDWFARYAFPLMLVLGAAVGICAGSGLT